MERAPENMLGVEELRLRFFEARKEKEVLRRAGQQISSASIDTASRSRESTELEHADGAEGEARGS